MSVYARFLASHFVCILCIVLSLRFSFSTIFHIYWQDEFLYSIENNNLLATSIRHSRALLPFLQIAFVILLLLLLLLFTAIIAVVGAAVAVAAVISRLWNHICLWVIELNKKSLGCFFFAFSIRPFCCHSFRIDTFNLFGEHWKHVNSLR